MEGPYINSNIRSIIAMIKHGPEESLTACLHSSLQKLDILGIFLLQVAELKTMGRRGGVLVRDEKLDLPKTRPSECSKDLSLLAVG